MPGYDHIIWQYSIEDYLLEHKQKNEHVHVFLFFICSLFHYGFKDTIKYTAISFILNIFMKAIFPGQAPVPSR